MLRWRWHSAFVRAIFTFSSHVGALHEPIEKQMHPQPSFLALGDSYTIGEGVAPEERWPHQLTHLLAGEGVELQEPLIVAKTGWTTGELAAGIAATRPATDHALVSLLIGVNDHYRGGDPGGYRVAFDALLEQAITFAMGEPHRVLVLSIPDWGVTPFAEGDNRERISEQIDAFNAENQAAAAVREAHYINVTAASRRVGDSPSYLVADGLHPSGAAYAEWARQALPAARRALAGERPDAPSR